MNIEQSKLYIKRRSLSEIMLFLVIIIPLISQFFIEMFKIPSVITLFIDVSLVGFVVIMILNKRFILSRQLTPFSCVILLFLIYTLVVYIFKFQSPFYYFWGVRNYFRFYVAFFAFVLMMNKNKADSYLKILDMLYWVNAVVIAVQILMGYRQDYLGGLFGVSKGCNASTLVFITIVVAKSLLEFMNGKEKITLCLLKSSIALVISVFSELKMFFFLFVGIVILATLLTSFSWKKISFLLVSAFFVFVASTILTLIFDVFQGFFSIEALIAQLTLENYASENDIGRFTAFKSLSERFLPTISDQLFGMGLGNCDTSAIPIFNTEFYDSYVSTHYSIFSHSFLFIETGIIGFLIYYSFFIISLVKSIKILKISDEDNKLFSQLAVVLSVVCFILIVYNSSLRTDIAYLIYFILALPFVDSDERLYLRIQRG